MSVVVALAALLLAAALMERKRHEQALRAIPIRIHVNGTRGKSSVTRLIAAGLNGAGIGAVAKTTGSVPRFILPDGQEEEVRRWGGANIREQLATVHRAAQLGAQAVVVECMAIEPELQRFSERLLLRSQITIITNVRPDQQEVLGPSPAKVAQAMLGTVPRRGTLILGDERLLPLFSRQLRGEEPGWYRWGLLRSRQRGRWLCSATRSTRQTSPVRWLHVHNWA